MPDLSYSYCAFCSELSRITHVFCFIENAGAVARAINHSLFVPDMRSARILAAAASAGPFLCVDSNFIALALWGHPPIEPAIAVH